MKITVLNGSPKGELSVTMQSVAYLAKLHPEHEFDVVHIAQRIRHFEKDRAAFDKLMEQIRASDAVLWGFPLYILVVHANYKRFIELIFERDAQNVFTGKYAAALSTSIHFFDHTAHNYMHGICDDLGMRFVDSFSADMDDLTKKEGRQQLENFGTQFFNAVKNQVPTQRQYPPLVRREFTYQPVAAPAPLSTSGKKVVILHDEKDINSNLAKMVDRCRASFTDAVTVVNIHDLDIKSSCLGCIECGSGKKCAFTDKDDYIEFYKSTVMTADILIYAGQMVDRYLSSRWKMFFDRIFFNTHTPVLIDKQVALVISGPLGQNPNLMEIMRGFFEFQGASISGVITDEYGDSAELDRLLDQLLARTLKFSTESYTHPMTYLGVGGMKVFRDDIYGRLRFVFDADHRAYKRMGVYKTFPQTEFKNMLFNIFVTPLVNLPPIRKQFDGMIKKEMVAPHKKVVEKAQPKAS